jgi:hypothetical protein
MAMVSARCTMGLHALGQFADAALAGDLGLREQRERASRRNRGCTPATKSIAWSHAQPGRQHRDVRDEAGLMHEQGALAERLAAEHLQLALVGGEPQHGAQRAGLAGAVRTDEADDASRLDGEVGSIERDERAVLFDRSRASISGGMAFVLLGIAAARRRRGMGERGGLREQFLGGESQPVDDRQESAATPRSGIARARPASSKRRAPSLTYMPRPRRFSTSPSSTSC